MGLLSRLFDPQDGGPSAAQQAAATVTGVNDRDDIPALIQQNAALIIEINRSAAHLPAMGVVLARAVTDSVHTVLYSADAEHLDISVRVAIHGVLTDYLPSSIRAYVGAVRALGPAGDLTHATDALVDQLMTLRRSVADLAQASAARDVQALHVQGRFLNDKFGRSELTL